MKTVESYMPVFSGFYNNPYWEHQEEMLYEYNDGFDISDVDWKDYHNAIAKEIADVLCERLRDEGFIEGCEFQELVSPRFYNHSTDQIYVEYALSNENIKNIKDFIYTHENEFEEFLKERYTSMSGFISYYSNEFSVWEVQTNNFTEFSEDQHYLGTILAFICQVLKIEEIAIAERVFEQVSIYEYYK